MKYRPDIDGLRALAVVPVVLYHVGVPGFAGGFVGVDIFFVISGYLICGMIDTDIRNGSFSLIDFYRRRILRIMPALFAMLLVTSGLAYLYCLPVELLDYARSLASAVGSVSNVYFAQTSGYFDGLAETKPLLHTWSLGVEEQFYFIAPLLMLLIYRFARQGAKLLFAIVAVISLAAALAMDTRNPTFVFYLTPFRAWELALGALLSVGFIPAPRSAVWRNLCGSSGLLLLFGIVLLGSPTWPLLLMTSLASIGAVLVIASSELGMSVAGRLLSLRPIVFVGLISYSLYLWHWPLIVFQHTDQILSTESAASTRLTLIALSFGFAYLSWKLVEMPFRGAARTKSRATIFVAASAAVVSVFAVCALVLKLSGMPYRFPERVVQVAAYLGYDPSATFRTGHCFLATNRQRLDIETCMTPDPNRSNYLIVGDSHAAHLWFGLAAALPEANIMQATASMCRPDAPAVSALDSRACPKLMHYVFDDFLANHRVDGVLLAAAWKDPDFPGLLRALDALKQRGIGATVLGPIVEYDTALPRLLAEDILRGGPSTTAARRIPGIRERDLAMKRMVTARGATYLSVYDAVCHDGGCDEFAVAGVAMQFDIGHLTAAGAVEVGRRLFSSARIKLAKAGHVSR